MRLAKNILLSATVALVFAGMTGRATADLVISQKKSVNVTCSAGICNATAANAVLNVKDLTNMLVTTDVHVFAEGVATDITVADPFSWASSHQLTLGAYGSINVKAAISITGTSGLTIITNIANTGGIFRLVGVGKISFWDTASTLVINGTAYTMINNLPALISAIAANPSGTYAFANDYDATQDGSYPHSPIPTTFTGTFEGLGNSLSNLTVFANNAGNIALFSRLETGGLISDINLVNVSVQANEGDVAPLVVTNNGAIVHVSSSGAIAGLGGGSNIAVAGLVVDNSGTITRSHAAVNLTDSIQAGGLVVSNEGTISLSDASGSVSSAFYSGGLAMESSGTISDSFAQGNVATLLTDPAGAGGLVAISSGTIQACFATGQVQDGAGDPKKKEQSAHIKAPGHVPGENLGGLVGISSGSGASIVDSYATGGLSAANDKHVSVGGLVGHNAGIIARAYALGLLSIKGQRYVGGIIGFEDSPPGSDNNAFWDFDTTEIQNPNQGAGNVFNDKGLIGLKDKNFRQKTISKFDPAIWAENPRINNGYPYLIANPPPQ